MRFMPVFAEAYGYTPAEFRALSLADFNMLAEHLSEKAKRQ